MKVILIGLLNLCLVGIAPLNANDHAIYNGQNILKPLTRFDILGQYQTGVTKTGGNNTTLTLRIEKVVDLPCGWQLSSRCDVPYSWYTCPHCRLADNCVPDDHLADVLAQILVIAPPISRWNYGYGLQMIFPTDGGNVEIGDAKYELHPTLGLAYDLDDWSPGAYCSLTLRQAFSVGGYPQASSINQTRIQPSINLNLSRDWFVNSSPEIRYNWQTKAWFVPIDLMVGWMITPKIIASIEYEYGLVQDYPQFNQSVEGRLGYFF